MKLNEILYVKSSGNYVVIVTDVKKIASRLIITETGNLLSDKEFIRVHRSYIISKTYVNKWDKHSVWIRDIEIPMGLSYVNELEKLWHFDFYGLPGVSNLAD